jgi:hypothetical protein
MKAVSMLNLISTLWVFDDPHRVSVRSVNGSFACGANHLSSSQTENRASLERRTKLCQKCLHELIGGGSHNQGY